MKKDTKTKRQLLLEMGELRTRLDATERRSSEADEQLQVQIAECKRKDETFEKVINMLRASWKRFVTPSWRSHDLDSSGIMLNQAFK